MRKGQQKVLDRAKKRDDFTEQELELLTDEKYPVSFYPGIFHYINQIHHKELNRTFEEIQEYIEFIFNETKGYSFRETDYNHLFYYISEENQNDIKYLLLTHKELFMSQYHLIIGYLFRYVNLKEDLSIKRVIEEGPKEINSLQCYVEVLGTIIPWDESEIHDIEYPLLKAYALELSIISQRNEWGHLDFRYDDVRLFLKRKNPLDVAKKYEFDYDKYISKKREKVKMIFQKYFPEEKQDHWVYKFLTDEDEANINIIKDTKMNCKIKCDIREYKYSYHDKFISFSFRGRDTVEMYHSGRNMKVISSGNIYDEIKLNVSYTTDNIIGIYIKRNNKSYPISIKDLSHFYHVFEYQGLNFVEYKNFIDCIEQICIDDGVFFIKDIMKYVRIGRFIPPLKFNDIFNYSNFQQVFKDKYPVPKNWNKNDINTLYCAYKIRKYITPVKQMRLFDIITTDLLDRADVWNVSFRRKSSTKRVIKDIFITYIKNRIIDAAINETSDEIITRPKKDIDIPQDNTYDNWEYEDGEYEYMYEENTAIDINGVIEDYIQMAIETKTGISYDFTSLKKVIEKHDALARKGLSTNASAEVFIPKKNEFRELRKLLPNPEFEWIKNSKRLNLEAEKQHHCVWMYEEKIKKGKCAIYHYDSAIDNKPYTIEFVKRDGMYRIAQMQTVCNKGYTKKAYEYVNGLIQEYNKRVENNIRME